MPKIAHDWELDVERGPNWLLVKVRNTCGQTRDLPPLAGRLWSLLDQYFTYRLVLELDQIGPLNGHLIGQLTLLDDRIRTHRGVMRLCGLSPRNAEVLRRCGLGERFPMYRDREEAIRGCHRPSQSR
jgi:hypothetical protein